MIQPTHSPLTPEQWLDVDAARKRLDAYKNKIQPYPMIDYPPNVTPSIIELDCQDCRTSKDVIQLKGNLISLRDILKKHVLETKPSIYSNYIYSSNIVEDDKSGG